MEETSLLAWAEQSMDCHSSGQSQSVSPVRKSFAQGPWRQMSGLRWEDEGIRLAKVSTTGQGQPQQLPDGFRLEHGPGLVFINGNYVESLSDLPEGIAMERLSKSEISDFLLKKDRRKRLETVGIDQPLLKASLNQIDEGWRINCSESVKMVCYYFWQGLECNQMVNACMAVHVQGGCSVVINEFHKSDAAQNCWVIENRFTSVSGSGHLTISQIENHHELLRSIKHHCIDVAASARYDDFVVVQGGQLTHQFRAGFLNGRRSVYDFKGLTIANARQNHSHQVKVQHVKSHATSSQLHKSIASDSGVSSYQGRIFVEKDAQHTTSSQSNHHLLLSPKAKAFSKPELEIYADKVVCQHGSTIGDLRKDLLWYLMSRGLDEKQARQLLIQSFIADLLEYFPDSLSSDQWLEVCLSGLGQLELVV